MAANIHPTAIIADDAVIAPGVTIGPFTVIGAHVEIGAGCIIGPHALINGPTRMGRDNQVFQYTSIGEGPQDLSYKGEPTRLPLKLVGDGTTPRYQDNAAGQVTLHSRESLASAGAALGDANLDEARFRHNIVIDGVGAWDEQAWVGRTLRVGHVEFETVVPKVRCLATHANPLTGERDLQVMQTLVQAFKQAQPTFGVGLLSIAGGEICVGDAVTF